MTPAAKLVVDEEKIKKAINSGLPLTITTYTLPREIEIYIEQVIEVFLKESNQLKLKDYIIYCVNELAVNAKKANTKRVYFTEHKLDINDPDDYKSGMKKFKEDTLSQIDYYLDLQKKERVVHKDSFAN